MKTAYQLPTICGRSSAVRLYAMNDDPQVLEIKQGGNGFKQWRLLQRRHSFYSYEEMTLQDEIYHVDEDGNDGVVVAEAYWQPTHASGLFDTREGAREDALATLPWLHEALANGD